jgi:SAM-dependent methyltransferase
VSDKASTAANLDQVDYWNAAAGETWAALQDQLDRQIEPLGLEAIQALAPRPGERVLDIGCGCGQSSLQLASRVTSAGAVVGVDISVPMLAVARARPIPADAATPAFREVDAQTGDLGEGVFDAAFSRFGVMFFSDPVVAFTRIRRSLEPGGRLAFVCWRPLQENPWMSKPMDAAQPFLAPPAPKAPAAPGPFAFADPDRVRAILSDAGWADIGIRPFDALIGGSSLDQTVDLAFRVGPLGAALRENPDRKSDIAEAVRREIAKFETPSGVLMPSAVWIVQAKVSEKTPLSH